MSVRVIVNDPAARSPLADRVTALSAGINRDADDRVLVAFHPSERDVVVDDVDTLAWFDSIQQADIYERIQRRCPTVEFFHGALGLDRLESVLAAGGLCAPPAEPDPSTGDALFELKGVYLQQLVTDVRNFLESCPEDPEESFKLWPGFLQRVEGSAGTYEFSDLSDAARKARVLFEGATVDPEREQRAADAITRAVNEAVAAHREQLSARIPDRIASDANHRALILATDAPLAHQLRLALTSSALEALVHDDPATFRDALRLVHPDIVIVEHALDGFDGFELAAQVRAEEAFQALPIVALLDDPSEKTRTRAAKAGVDTWLLRPFSADNAVSTVRAILDRSDAQMALGGRDPVTGLFSRRALLDRLELELLRARRASERVALMLIHIEAAPRDSYPRQLLLDLATSVDATFRRSDILGRYNEKTVAAVLPGADPRIVESLIERLVEAMDPGVELRISASIADGSATPSVVAADAETRLIQALEGQPGAAVGRCAGADDIAAKRTHAPRVLLVDNDEAILTLLRFFCQREGFIVEEARDGLSAIERLEASAEDGTLPDLVILEAYLPGVDGFSVLRKIQSAFGTRVGVMMLTIQRNEERIAKAFNLGAADFVAKPFSVPEVMARIRNILLRSGAL